MKTHPRFIETIRIENAQIPLLPFHIQRFEKTYQNHFDTKPIDLQEFINQLKLPKIGIHALRIVYNSAISNYSFNTYRIKYFDELILTKTNINYSFKYLNRIGFLEKTKQMESRQIPLFVKNGFITDTSIHNVAFLKNDTWFTPDSPLLCGVRRAKLLQMGKLKEIRISIKDLLQYEKCKIFNAMITFEEAQSLPIPKISEFT